MVEFRLLGPLEAGDGHGTRAQLGSGKQLALLAYLVLHRNLAVPRERLIDVLWPDDPPASAAHALDVYVSRLRRTLGGDGLLESQRGTLRLNVADDAVDAARFERLLAAAREEPRPEERLARLDEALALWRGRALADVLGDDFARHESERLEEERLGALELRLETLVALGRHDDAIGPLRALAGEQPLRERPRRLLMLALYRAGRQSEALDVYRVFRRLLADELGLEPSPELRALEAAILRHDRELAAAAAPSGPVAPAAAGRRAGRRRLIAAAAAVAAAAAGVALGLLLTRGESAATLVVPDDAAAAIDPASGRVVVVVPLHGQPVALLAQGGSVWVASPFERTLTRIDDRTGAVRATVGLPAQPIALAAGAGRIWVASHDPEHSLTAVDPRSGEVLLSIPLRQPGLGPFADQGRGANGVAFGYGSVWATVGISGLLRVSPAGRVRHAYVVGPEPAAVTVGGGGVWVAVVGPRQLVGIDPRSDSVGARVTVGVLLPSDPLTHLGTDLCTLAATTSSVWVPSYGEAPASSGVWVVDPVHGAIRAVVHPGGSPCGVSLGHRRVWVANPNGFEVDEIEPATNELVRRIPLAVPPNAIAAAPRHIWVTTS